VGNNNIPYQLYVRISNRLVGDYVMTQNNICQPRWKPDSIAVGDWSFDEHMYGARFRQKIPLEDDIGSHTCSLEASMRVTNGIPLGCSLLLPVHTINCVQTLKDRQVCRARWER
jgi:hypothetical protein